MVGLADDRVVTYLVSLDAHEELTSLGLPDHSQMLRWQPRTCYYNSSCGSSGAKYLTFLWEKGTTTRARWPYRSATADKP
jgi:hypothetical protein